MEDSEIKDIIDQAQKIGMLQHPKEITDFAVFLQNKNIKHVLEIGTARGGTFYVWCKIADKDGKKISVDDPFYKFGRSESIEHFIEIRNQNMKTWADNVFIIEGNSHDRDTVLEVKKILQGDELDLLFIDGDHSFYSVRQDYEMYKDLVREDGYIAFHDINGSYESRRNLGYVFIFWALLHEDTIEFNENLGFWGIGVIQKKKKI